MNQIALIRGASAGFLLGMRTRSRDILLAAAPAIAVATVARVLTPFLFRSLLASGRSTAVLSRQLVAINLLIDFLILLTAIFAIAAFLHIARSSLSTQRAYERLSPVTLPLLGLTLIFSVLWIALLALQLWAAAGSQRFRALIQTATGRTASQIISFILVSVFLALLLSVPALAEQQAGLPSALRSALRLLSRALLGCALLLLLFDIAANALVNWIFALATAATARLPSLRSASLLLALLAYITGQIIRYLGLYALVCLYLEAKQKPEQNAPAA